MRANKKKSMKIFLIVIILVFFILLIKNEFFIKKMTISYIYEKAKNELSVELNKSNIQNKQDGKIQAEILSKIIDNIIWDLNEKERKDLITSCIEEESSKSYFIFNSLINYYVKTQNRKQVVSLFSLRCPSGRLNSPNIFYVAQECQKYFERPLNILFDAYEQSRCKQSKDYILSEFENAFCAYHIYNETDKPDIIIKAIRKWYNENYSILNKINMYYENDVLSKKYKEEKCSSGLFILDSGQGFAGGTDNSSEVGE